MLSMIRGKIGGHQAKLAASQQTVLKAFDGCVNFVESMALPQSKSAQIILYFRHGDLFRWRFKYAGNRWTTDDRATMLAPAFTRTNGQMHPVVPKPFLRAMLKQYPSIHVGEIHIETDIRKGLISEYITVYKKQMPHTNTRGFLNSFNASIDLVAKHVAQRGPPGDVKILADVGSRDVDFVYNFRAKRWVTRTPVNLLNMEIKNPRPVDPKSFMRDILKSHRGVSIMMYRGGRNELNHESISIYEAPILPRQTQTVFPAVAREVRTANKYRGALTQWRARAAHR
jgi:hypothetical protein